MLHLRVGAVSQRVAGLRGICLQAARKPSTSLLSMEMLAGIGSIGPNAKESWFVVASRLSRPFMGSLSTKVLGYTLLQRGVEILQQNFA